MSSPRPCRFEIREAGAETVLTLTDKNIFESATVAELGADLNEFAEKLGRQKIVMDFGNVDYFSSAALGKIITFKKKVDAAGGELILCNMAPQVYDVFEQTSLSKLFKIRRQINEDDPASGLM